MAEPRPILIDLPEQIVGERIVLRPWRDDDAAAWYALVDHSREHLKRWMTWPVEFKSFDDARAFVRRQVGRWTLREDFTMGIFDGAGTLLGAVGLHPRDWKIPSFEVGYWIGAPYEGRGYVTEAVQIVTRLAFEVLGANRVFILCDAENQRSAEVARRCGYVLEGTLRSDERAPDGSLRSTMVFALLPSDRRSNGQPRR